MSKLKREADGIVHSRPGSVDQQSEDSFPTSDSPGSSPGAIGAPERRKTEPLHAESDAVTEAEKKVKSGQSKAPHKY
jgi:hypothetical protein